jgi:prepilin-type N-terminal cleavage/methylation domain-containing protein
LPLLQTTTQDRSHVRSAVQRQHGFVMIEMMLAVAIVGTAMFAAVTAFSTSSKTSLFVQETTTAEWLATSQMELIRTAAYQLTPNTYADVPAPTGYSIANVTSAVSGGDENIQIVTIEITRNGASIYEASTLKVNR